MGRWMRDEHEKFIKCKYIFSYTINVFNLFYFHIALQLFGKDWHKV